MSSPNGFFSAPRQTFRIVSKRKLMDIQLLGIFLRGDATRSAGEERKATTACNGLAFGDMIECPIHFFRLS